MKVNINLNGKTAELDIPDEKLVELGLVEEKKPTGYERVEHGCIYHYIDSEDNMVCSQESNHSLDYRRFNIGNYYPNEEVAEANARADTLMRKLRRFAAENGGIPSVEDWKDGSVRKYCIYASYGSIFDDTAIKNPKIRYIDIYSARDAFQIYFKSKEACNKAIEEFKDELTWYFTEYQAMLY
jgi:hypothetical protein